MEPYPRPERRSETTRDSPEPRQVIEEEAAQGESTGAPPETVVAGPDQADEESGVAIEDVQDSSPSSGPMPTTHPDK